MNKLTIEKKENTKTTDLAAEALAQILIQQVMSKRIDTSNKEIETKYGKPNQ